MKRSERQSSGIPPSRQPIGASFASSSSSKSSSSLRYVVDGSCLEWGLPAEKLLREVHRSNMSKLSADGKPILRSDGKVLKGPNYIPPMLEEIIHLYSGIDNSGSAWKES